MSDLAAEALAADAVYQRGFDHGRHRSAEDVVKFAEPFRGHTRDMLLKAARVALNGPETAPTSPSEPVPSTPRVPGSTERPEGVSAVQYGYRYRAEGRAWTRTWKCKDRDEAESLVAHVRGDGAADAEVMTRIVESWRPLTEVEETNDAD